MANYWVHINATGSKELEHKIDELFNSSEWETHVDARGWKNHKGFMIYEICHCDHQQEELCKTCRPILEDD